MHFFVRGLVGMVIGALISLHEEGPAISRMRPFAAALTLRITRFAHAFRQIIFAQVKISALNTIFTGIFLAGILPAFGVHLPLTKTLIAITFLAGLLPVIGNLISNTLIFIVGLSISIYVAIVALALLGGHSQAGIFSQRKNRWHTNSSACLGTLARHDCPGSGIRYGRAHCCPDLLRVHQERTFGCGSGLAPH